MINENSGADVHTVPQVVFRSEVMMGEGPGQ